MGKRSLDLKEVWIKRWCFNCLRTRSNGSLCRGVKRRSLHVLSTALYSSQFSFQPTSCLPPTLDIFGKESAFILHLNRMFVTSSISSKTRTRIMAYYGQLIRLKQLIIDIWPCPRSLPMLGPLGFAAAFVGECTRSWIYLSHLAS